MKKTMLALLMCAGAAALSGCSGNNSPETAESVYEESASTENSAPGITIGHIDVAAKTDVNGDPVIEDIQDTYYSYKGRRWWHDLSEPSAAFVEKNGEYSAAVSDNDPAGGERDDLAIYAVMREFSSGGWSFAGELEQHGEFYINTAQDTMVQMTDITADAERYGITLAQGEKLVLAALLKPSAA